MFCNKENVIQYLEYRVKDLKDTRTYCKEDEKDVYEELTMIIETLEQLIKEVKVVFSN